MTDPSGSSRAGLTHIPTAVKRRATDLCPISPQHPGSPRATRCSNRWSGAPRACKHEEIEAAHPPPPRDKDRTPLIRAGAWLLMAGLLYMLWPSAETAYLAMESVIR
uniref:Uncharacterized protein n=1 Tax=Burkholderia orbicola (strain AU 1054) TaxID=331271 RepID=A0A0H2XP36_BURO1